LPITQSLYILASTTPHLTLPKQNGAKLPSSDIQVELVYRKGGLQITAKGTIAELAQGIGSITQFANLALETLHPLERGIAPAVPPEFEATVDYPVIKPTNSLTDNIVALFQTNWGRSPRGLEDVSKALETNGVPDSDSSIGATLLRLVKQGQIRRIKKGDKWQYFMIPQS
jgi:hypothetical protein